MGYLEVGVALMLFRTAVHRSVERLKNRCDEAGLPHHFGTFVMPKKATEKFFADYFDSSELEALREAAEVEPEVLMEIVGDQPTQGMIACASLFTCLDLQNLFSLLWKCVLMSLFDMCLNVQT